MVNKKHRYLKPIGSKAIKDNKKKYIFYLIGVFLALNYIILVYTAFFN